MSREESEEKSSQSNEEPTTESSSSERSSKAELDFPEKELTVGWAMPTLQSVTPPKKIGGLEDYFRGKIERH